MRIDLHSHTNVSDGLESPEALVTLAKGEGLDVLAITDHDTVDGWQSLRSNPLAEGLTILPGAEISCKTHSGMSVHILGYLFDPRDSHLTSLMSLTRDDRIPRIKKIIELLNQAGIAITFEEVASHAKSAKTIGRPHLADALIEIGVVSTRDEAFAEFLHNDSPYYVGHMAPSPQEAIAAIKAAGGVSVLAHGLAQSRGAIYRISEIEELIRQGLDGLEVDHRDHNSGARKCLRGLAKDHQLFATGSSDYHGSIGGQRLGMELTQQEVWEGILSKGSGCEVFTI